MGTHLVATKEVLVKLNECVNNIVYDGERAKVRVRVRVRGR